MRTAAPWRPALPAFWRGDLNAQRSLCLPLRAIEALDLPILPKNTEGIRSKLKRLVARGILTEPEPGLFSQPRT